MKISGTYDDGFPLLVHSWYGNNDVSNNDNESNVDSSDSINGINDNG